MNKQGNADNPKGGIEWTHFFGPRTGYTANPVRGCEHRCEWEMPDGHIARCYAKDVAEGIARAAYPKGFEHVSFHSEELAAIGRLETPAGIFIDSMSDLFGQSVNKFWIDATIQCLRDNPQHVYFSLTKNPTRFREFTAENKPWPANWLVGISAPPTFMFGKKLDATMQRAWLKRGLEFLRDSPAQLRWISIEPLSFDIAPILAASDCPLDFAVIGAASRGAITYQPDRIHFWNALQVLKCPVFFKGNLSRNLAIQVAGSWREEFPKVTTTPKTVAAPELF